MIYRSRKRYKIASVDNDPMQIDQVTVIGEEDGIVYAVIPLAELEMQYEQE